VDYIFTLLRRGWALILLLRGLNPSGSLWTFRECTLGLAADCLSVSSNSPSFVNTLTGEGHRLEANVNGRGTYKGNNEANCSGEEGWDHQNAEPTYIKAIVGRGYPITKLIPGIRSLGIRNWSGHWT